MKQDQHNHKLLTIFFVFLIGFIAGCASHKNKNYLINIFTTQPPPPPPIENVSSDIRDKPILKGMQYIWEYQEDFAYRHKRLPLSITEMGDGTQIGRNGIVTRRHIWEARNESENRKPDPETGNHYFYHIVQVCNETVTNVSAIVAIPVDKTNAYFVAVCGPFDLANPLSFKRKASIHKLSCDFSKHLNKMISNLTISSNELNTCLTHGAKSKLQYESFFALDRK